MTPEEFENQVVEILRLQGFEVIPQLNFSTNRPDGYIWNRRGPGKPHRTLLECKRYQKGKIGPSLFQKFLNLVNNGKIQGKVDSGLMVSLHGCTASVLHETQKEECPVEVLSFTDLQRRFFDIRSYLTVAMDEWRKKAPIVVARDLKPTPDKPISKAGETLYQIAMSGKPQLFCLLGGPGTGKTTQLLDLALKLAEKYLANKSVPVPIYIPLTYLATEINLTIESYTYQLMTPIVPEPVPKWPYLKSLSHQGRLIFLFDGIDEIKGIYKSKHLLRELVRILRSIGHEATCILTCRSALLESEADLKRVFFERLPRQFPEVNISARYLMPFTHDDITEYLTRSQQPKTTLKRLQEIDSPDLLDRPLLLKYLTQLSHKNTEPLPLREFDILQETINFMLDYKIETHDTDIEPESWRNFLEECALRMSLENTSFLAPPTVKSILAAHLNTYTTNLLREGTQARLRTLFEMDERGLVFQHLVFRDFLSAFALARILIDQPDHAQELHNKILSREVARYFEIAYPKIKEASTLQVLDKHQKPPRYRSKLKWQWVAPGLFIRNRRHSLKLGLQLKFYSRGFWILETPLTREQFWMNVAEHATLKVAPPRVGPDKPLTSITQEEAARVSEIIGGRLPSEEEWERAAGWFDGSHPSIEELPPSKPGQNSPTPVKRARPNPWGIFDICGSVWQWTSDTVVESGTNIIKGSYWGANREQKLDTSAYLTPTKPYHSRTGVRAVANDIEGK